MKNLIVKIVWLSLVMLISSCSDDDPVINNIITPDTSPMWPQVGYNGRHTNNPSALNVFIPSVDEGMVNWIYTFAPGPGCHDGSEASIDSRGNIYHLSTCVQNNFLTKFSSDGTIIWQRDTLNIDGYFGIALSKDESRIYYSDFDKFSCRDSSGNLLWIISNHTYSIVPVIDNEGTIYTQINFKFSAVSPDGVVKWQDNAHVEHCWPSLDRDGNIYLQTNNSGQIQIRKFNKDGNVLWSYVADSDNLYYYSIVIDGYNNLYFRSNYGLTSLNKNGEVRWIRDSLFYSCISAISKSNIIFADSVNYLIALDTLGNSIWKTYIGDYYHPEPYLTLDDDDNIYFKYSDNFTPAICSVSKSGVIRWKLLQPAPGLILPGQALSPLKMLFSTPKRPGTVYTIK